MFIFNETHTRLINLNMVEQIKVGCCPSGDALLDSEEQTAWIELIFTDGSPCKVVEFDRKSHALQAIKWIRDNIRERIETIDMQDMKKFIESY